MVHDKTKSELLTDICHQVETLTRERNSLVHKLEYVQVALANLI